jgi:TonB family protein
MRFALNEDGAKRKGRITMHFPPVNRVLAVGLLLLGGCAAIGVPRAWGQEDINRKVKTKVDPMYPQLAKRMNLAGVVRVEVTVSPNGLVKNAKLIGGHPVLATAALDAVKKWRYESGSEESTGVVEFRFDPR